MAQAPIMKTKQDLIQSARRTITEIQQYFAEAKTYNQNTGDRVDPDPDGSVLRVAHALEQFVYRSEPIINV
jgi:hypothetical protein